MTTIRIPESNEGVLDQLGEVGRLISAKKWERAALITALVGPAPGQGARTDTSVDLPKYVYTPATLAALDIGGLRSDKTIRHYRDQWCKHRNVPNLGDDVDLDGLPDWAGTDTVRKREQREQQPVPDSLTYPSPIKTHPDVGGDIGDVEGIAARQRRVERADDRNYAEQMDDEFHDRGDRNRHGGGLRAVPDVPTEEPESPVQKAMRLLYRRVVDLKQDVKRVEDAMPLHYDDLHPSSQERFWSLVDELIEEAEKLRGFHDAYTEKQE